MNNERPFQELTRLLAFLAKAPVDQVIPRAKVSQFPRGELVCSREQLANGAFLVLGGRCELRHNRRNAGTEVVDTFKCGATFGGYTELLLGNDRSMVVAVEDSVVLGIRLDELADLAAGTNGDETIRRPTAPDQKNKSTTVFFRPPKGKVSTLVFLSNSVPAPMLCEGVARQLHLATGQSVVLVELVAIGSSISEGGEAVDFVLDGEVIGPFEMRSQEGGFQRLRVGLTGEPPAPEAIGELLRRLRACFEQVLVAISSTDIPTPHLFEGITESDAAYFFLRRNAEDLYHLDLLLHELRPTLNGHVPVKLRPVVCLAEKETVDDFDTRIESIGIPAHAYIRGCPVPADPLEPASFGAPAGPFHADVRRLARQMGDCLVGLALSTGGAKGFAHIGVIQVLEENGIEVDVISGASMGAYVGSLWAFGCHGQELERLARETEGRLGMWRLVDPVFPPRQGFMGGFAVKRRLQRTIGEVQFADLLRPLRIVATNLDTLERAVFSNGTVADAVHASCAVPGVCVPVRIGEETYVDGGVADPLPTDVLQEMGVRTILAVNTIPTPEHYRSTLQTRRELAGQLIKRKRRLGRDSTPLAQQMNLFARGNILEILVHSFHGSQTRVAEVGGRRAALVLRPVASNDHWLDFRHTSKYIAAGRDEATRHLDEIKALLHEKITSHEHEPTTKPLAAIA